MPRGCQYHNFTSFAPGPEEVETHGMDGAFNRALELSFGSPHAAAIKFKDRSPGLVAVVDQLQKFTSQFPSNMVLQKWITDLIDCAKRGHDDFKNMVIVLSS